MHCVPLAFCDLLIEVPELRKVCLIVLVCWMLQLEVFRTGPKFHRRTHFVAVFESLPDFFHSFSELSQNNINNKSFKGPMGNKEDRNAYITVFRGE